MTTKAELVSEGVNLDGVRLTSVRLRYPNFIHADVVARRELTFTAPEPTASAESMIEDVLRDAAMPSVWATTGQGQLLEVPAFMEAGTPSGELMALSELAEFSEETRLTIFAAPLSTATYFADVKRAQEFAWLEARDLAIVMAKRLERAGHDSIARLLLGPFAHIEVIATASDWSPFLQWTSQFPPGTELAELGHCINAQLNLVAS